MCEIQALENQVERLVNVVGNMGPVLDIAIFTRVPITDIAFL